MKKNKELNDSQSEEQYNKKLEAQRIAKAKYLQKESYEKKIRLEKQSIRREHDESIRSQL